jgi:uncharacterized protein YbjT (DUF2867 family)
MSILILGSTGPTGELLVRRLRARGRRVIVIHRSEQRRAEYESLGVRVITGDAFDRDSIIGAMQVAADEADAVINLIGGNPFQPPETWPDYEGNVNVIDGAVAVGLSRFIFVTSVGTGESWQFVPDEAKYIKPIIELKTKAEQYLKSTDLDWTIIKPGGLGPPGYKIKSGHPLITENHAVRGLIDRNDLSGVIERVLMDSTGLTRGKELYVVTDRIQVLEGEASVYPLPEDSGQ